MKIESSTGKELKIQNNRMLLDAILTDTAQQPSIYKPDKYGSSKALASYDNFDLSSTFNPEE
jgi:hypothetical protein